MTQSMFDKLRHGSRGEPSRREAEQRVEEQRIEAEHAEARRGEEQRTQEDQQRAEDAARDAERDAQPREQERAAPVEQRFGTSFLADGNIESAWQRWHELQSNFVDDPQSAVKQADGLVTELIDGIVRRFETEREQLEARWSKGQEVSTEDLRRCLQRYRDFFGRLLRSDPDRAA